MENLNWNSTLADLFASVVNQQTFEEAAQMMVFVSEDDKSYHKLWLTALDEGIRAARNRNPAVVDCINNSGSGYRAVDADDAAELLVTFRDIYIKEYQDATGSPELK